LMLEYGQANGISLHRFDPDVYFRIASGANRIDRLGEYIQETAKLVRLLVKERDQTILARITGYIRMHFRNPALKIQDIANEVHFSTAYLSYLFKQEMKKNLWDYVTEHRINEAKLLLATTDKKRYEVAYEVGYESPEHFGRMFKRYAGVSPAEYRKEGQGGSG
jgi:two-component system response regulator YesN